MSSTKFDGQLFDWEWYVYSQCIRKKSYHSHCTEGFRNCTPVHSQHSTTVFPLPSVAERCRAVDYSKIS